MIPVREDWGKYTSKYPNVQGFSFDFAYEDNYDYNKVRDTVVDIFEKNGCEVEAIQFDTSTFVPGYDDRHDTTVGLDISLAFQKPWHKPVHPECEQILGNGVYYATCEEFLPEKSFPVLPGKFSS